MEVYRALETGIKYRETFHQYQERRNKIQLQDEIDDEQKLVYDVTRLYWQEGVCQYVAKSNSFFLLTMFVVLFNAVWIAIDEDHNDAQVLSQAEWHFQFAE